MVNTALIVDTNIIPFGKGIEKQMAHSDIKDPQTEVDIYPADFGGLNVDLSPF